jgi:hypothetical protein
MFIHDDLLWFLESVITSNNYQEVIKLAITVQYMLWGMTAAKSEKAGA